MSKAKDRNAKRLFAIGQAIAVPADVHLSQQGRIVGLGIKNGGATRLYYLLFAEGGRAWEATEEELIAWQEDGSK